METIELEQDKQPEEPKEAESLEPEELIIDEPEIEEQDIEQQAESVMEPALQPGEKSKKQQMIESIVEEALRTKEMPHFSVIGNSEDKIMEVTKTLMRELCEKGVIKTPRIARISAAKVNSINLEEKKEQLEGSCLLIEEAHELSLDSLQTLCQIMKRMRINVVVGFVDEENAMNELLNRNRKLKSIIKYELYV